LQRSILDASFFATGNWQLATGNWQLATGNWQLATGNWQLLIPKGELPEIDLESVEQIINLPRFKPLGFLYLPSFP
jgi:hypothetical protein